MSSAKWHTGQVNNNSYCLVIIVHVTRKFLEKQKKTCENIKALKLFAHEFANL